MDNSMHKMQNIADLGYSKIEDMLNELYEIDEDELSEADLAYYLEVIGRINTKLLKVSYS